MSMLTRIFRLRAFHKEPVFFGARVVQWGVAKATKRRTINARSAKYGFTMCLPVGKEGYGSRGFFLLRDYYEPFYEILDKLIKPGDVFFDCGANQGIFTLAAAKLVGEKGKVFAFEPQPYAVRCVQDNVALNGFDNVTIIEAAVSDEVGHANLDLSSSEVSASIITDFGGTNTINVKTIRLDDIAKEHGVAPDIIKLDVEGAEFMALSGAANILENHKPLLVLEVTDPAMDHVKEFHKLLCSKGYEPHALKENELVAIDGLTTPEANIVYRHRDQKNGIRS